MKSAQLGTLPHYNKLALPKTQLSKHPAKQPSAQSAGESVSGRATVIVSQVADTPSKKWADLVEMDEGEFQQEAMSDENHADGYLPCAAGNSSCCHSSRRPRDETSSEDEEPLEIILHASPCPSPSTRPTSYRQRSTRPSSAVSATGYSWQCNPCSPNAAGGALATPCSYSQSSSNNPTASSTAYFYSSSSPGGAVASPSTPCSYTQKSALAFSPTCYYAQASHATAISSSSYYSVSSQSAPVTPSSSYVMVSPDAPPCRKGPSPICYYNPAGAEWRHVYDLPPVEQQTVPAPADYKIPCASARKLDYHDQSNSRLPYTAESSTPLGTSIDQYYAVEEYGTPEGNDGEGQFMDDPFQWEAIASAHDEESIPVVGNIQQKEDGRGILETGTDEQSMNLPGATQLEQIREEVPLLSRLAETPATTSAVQQSSIVPIQWPLSVESAVRRTNGSWPLELNYFNGVGSPRLHDEAERWLKNLGCSVLVNGWDFATAFKVVGKKLQGTARTWYKQNEIRFSGHQQGLAVGWAEFWTGFAVRFIKNVLEKELGNRVQRPGESLEDYAASIKGLARRLGYHVDDANVRFQLIKGIIDPDMRAKLETLLPSSFQDILHKVNDYHVYNDFVKMKIQTLSQSVESVDQVPMENATQKPKDVREGQAEKQATTHQQLRNHVPSQIHRRTETTISSWSGQVTVPEKDTSEQPEVATSLQEKPTAKQAAVTDNQGNTGLSEKATRTTITSSQSAQRLPEEDTDPQQEGSLPKNIGAIPEISTITENEVVPSAEQTLTEAPIEPLVTGSLLSQAKVPRGRRLMMKKPVATMVWKPIAKPSSSQTNGTDNLITSASDLSNHAAC